MRPPRVIRLLNQHASIQAALSLLMLLALAECGIRLLAPGHRYLLPPLAILSRLPHAWANGLMSHAAYTVARALTGFVIASAFGVVLGVLIGRWKYLRAWTMPIVDLFRPLPSSAILPVATLLLGLGEPMYLFVIVFGGVWPILLNTITGVQYVDSTLRDAVGQMRFGPLARLWTFVLPEAAAEIAAGLRISLSVCLILTVTAELFVGLGKGLGRFMSLAEDGGDYALMYLLVIVIALVGWVLNRGLDAVISWVPWTRNQYDSDARIQPEWVERLWNKWRESTREHDQRSTESVQP